MREQSYTSFNTLAAVPGNSAGRKFRPNVHARRIQALKALTYAPSSNSEILSRLYEIVFGLLDKVADEPQKRKKGIFGTKGGDKEVLEATGRRKLHSVALFSQSLAYLVRVLVKFDDVDSLWDKVGYLSFVWMLYCQELQCGKHAQPGECSAVEAIKGIIYDGSCSCNLLNGAIAIGSIVQYSYQQCSAVAIGWQSVAITHPTYHDSKCARYGGCYGHTWDDSDVRLNDVKGYSIKIRSATSVVEIRGALQDILHLHDVLARVALARLCHAISRARSLDERPDIKSQFNSVLYQLLLDPSERVCFEAILCVLGKSDNAERTEERAGGWYRVTREILKLPEAPSVSSKGADDDSKDSLPPKAAKEKSPKTRRPQPLFKLVMRRFKLEASFRSYSRPVLHAAARVVQEMGKSRAAAFAVGLQDIDERAHVNEVNDSVDEYENPLAEGARKVSPVSNGTGSKDTIASLLASLMEVVRTTVACECVYVRAMVIKALIWMQSPHESFDELESIIASELSDPAWPATLLNDILLTLHARFKATPDMAVTLLEIARIFATKVPGKIDADVLQLLWKVWFLGENANYAASEYAWESATPPGTALMMLDADKMVAAASSRNPTLAGALTRLQRCAFSGSWEVRIIAAQALTTMAIRSGEPYRLQIYEFLHALAQGGVQSQFSDMHVSNGEDQGASGTGLGSLISPMLKVLDEMYSAQDELIKEMRNHDNAKKEWTDEELKKLYETHERLLDLVSLFCFVPRAKYLPLGPTSAKLIDIYRSRHNITASTGLSDPAVATGISDLIYEMKATKETPVQSDALDDDLVNEFLAGAGTDAPDVEENIITRSSVSYDDMWAKTLLETAEVEEDDGRSSGSDSPGSTGSIETSISSHFGGMNYPSLFSSKPSSYGSSQPTERPATNRHSSSSMGSSSMYEGFNSPIREEPPPYTSPVRQRYESFENPLGGNGSTSFESGDEERVSSGNSQFGTALYDFTAGGDDELSLTAGEDVEIDYEVDGWFYVKKKRPGRDGKMAGLVPVLYVKQS
ncbi:hypothetical protein RHGRI_000890 [Rhododendron griersonianum]|uniref:SH3 domain-containing protein n=1 Tax=Rhododendron griersonianum TaxID=479676 RepID=A0AAV6LJ73_9ERIC|nr:hypothetical protein RHGRI_000890 [Rhododendron griersonianum]